MKIMYMYGLDAGYGAVRAAATEAGCEAIKTVRLGVDHADVPGDHHEADHVMSRLRDVPGVVFAHIVGEDFK